MNRVHSWTIIASLILGIGAVNLFAAADEPSQPAEVAQPPASDGETAKQPAAEQTPVVSEEQLTQWQSGGWAMLQKFCLECHNADYQEAEIDLTPFADVAHAESDPEMWNRVLQMIRFGAMPPDDALLPTDAERSELSRSIDQAIYSMTCDLRPKSGRVTARRLNRVEYNHTIRDLFGVELDLTGDFPSDEVGGGFDNNADVLAMPPMLFEKYLDAAEMVASSVLLDPESLKKETIEMVGERLAIVGEGFTESFYGRIFPHESFAWVEFEIETPGVYRVRVNGSGATDKQQEQPIAVYDGSGKPLLAETFKFGDGGGNHSATVDHEFAAGTFRLLVATLPETPADLSELAAFDRIDRLDEEALAAGRDQFEKSLTIDREIPREELAFLLRKVIVEGPRDFPQEMLPPSQSVIVQRVATKRGNDYVEVERAAKLCLEPLIRRVFRGPVDEETLGRYVGLVKAATDRGASYHRGLQDAITGMLVSPRFLFRVELPAPGVEPDEGGEFRLTDHQLASRLSYFLWSSMPDEELLGLADEGKLFEPEVLANQVDRMLQDPKAASLGSQFAAQWLGLRNLDSMTRDESKFPEFSPELVASMTGETQRLFLDVLRNNHPAGELLNADYTYLDAALADFYGITLPSAADASDANVVDTDDNGFVRVSLEGSPRRGILTHASVLTLTSFPTRTSPVLRGKWILESILGTPAPEPPPNVPELEDAGEDTSSLPMRQQLVIHRENPSCSSCHRVMDELGFGFEDYDAIGRYRGDSDIDASGELPGGRAFTGGRELAEILRKTENARFATTVAEKLLAFGIGRELNPNDRCVIEQIIGLSESDDHRLADLVKQVVVSRPFQYFEAESGVYHESE
ncbi:MAG: DUF1592 domain-containing protein [Planctomycetaceae bacterium]|nr:MAG: DUF1592 domain-containing protein [Planctomycetaceae bacterium]